MTEPKPRIFPVRPPLGPTFRRTAASRWVWDVVLALLSLAWSSVFLRLYYPGRMNVDIVNQYRQAVGEVPVTDWHPPAMSVVWRMLIDVTGQTGSLLVLQVGLLTLAAWLIGVMIHRVGAPRWVSLLGPGIMAAPWVLSQMTTLWKDTQMAVAMLLAVVLLTITRVVPKAWLLWIPAFVLLVYAVGVRKNAVFAVVPVAVYWGCFAALAWRRVRNRRDAAKGRNEGADDDMRTEAEELGAPARPQRRMFVGTAAASLIVLVAIGVGVKATDAMIESHIGVEHTGQISQIFLDDVMFSVPDAELMAADAPEELKKHISSSRDKCLTMGEIWDAYWNCYGRGETGRSYSPIAYQDELRSLWLHEVAPHPIRYIEYRSAVYSHYFFTSRLEYWEAASDKDAVKEGIHSGSVKADYIFGPYVEGFARDTFPMLFKPWFWALLAVILLGLGVRVRSHDRARGSDRVATSAPARFFWPEVTMLAASALCYIFGYFPIVPANHFRYTYWPAVAVTVGLVLVLAMWRSARRSHSVAHRIQRVRNLAD